MLVPETAAMMAPTVSAPPKNSVVVIRLVLEILGGLPLLKEAAAHLIESISSSLKSDMRSSSTIEVKDFSAIPAS